MHLLEMGRHKEQPRLYLQAFRWPAELPGKESDMERCPKFPFSSYAAAKFLASGTENQTHLRGTGRDKRQAPRQSRQDAGEGPRLGSRVGRDALVEIRDAAAGMPA